MSNALVHKGNRSGGRRSAAREAFPDMIAPLFATRDHSLRDQLLRLAAAARRSGGRWFTPSSGDLGAYVVSDYIRARRGRRGSRAA